MKKIMWFSEKADLEILVIVYIGVIFQEKFNNPKP